MDRGGSQFTVTCKERRLYETDLHVGELWFMILPIVDDGAVAINSRNRVE